jgi:hypothetical protein
MSKVPAEVSEYMRKIGARGGAAGKGSAKKRGSKAFYKKLGRTGGLAKGHAGGLAKGKTTK